MQAWWLVIILLVVALFLAAGLLRRRTANQAGIKPDELYRQLKEGLVRVIDVREPEEYQDGHVPGSILVPLRTLAVKKSAIPGDKPIVTVCRTGRRSATAAAELTAAGFAGVKSLEGGMAAWPYEAERGSGAAL